MNRYIITRFLLMIPLLLAVTLVNFFLYSLAPGDPASMIVNEQMMAGGYMDAEQLAAMLDTQRAMLGLDKPWYERYIIWLGAILRGNLGQSMVSSKSVTEIIGPHIWPTLQINLISIAFTTVLGVGLGVLQAIKKYSFFDYTAAFLTFFYASMPGFFLALLLIYIFAVQLAWLPSSGYLTAGVPPTIGDRIRHLILPVATLSLGGIPFMMRIARTAMLEVMGEDYIRTARSKGLRERVTLIRHALRNSLIPIVTVLGGTIMWLFSGSVIVETIFRWPGMGSLFIRVVGERDYPTIMGIVMISSLLSVVVVLIVDIAYTLIDPRVRLEK